MNSLYTNIYIYESLPNMAILNAFSSDIQFIWCWCKRLNTNQNLLVWWFNYTFMIQITCSMEVEPQLWNLKCSRHVAQSRRWGYHCRLFWCLDPNDQCYDGQLRSLKGCSSELQSFLPTIAKNPFYIHFVSYLFFKQNIFGIVDFNYFSNTLL